MYKVLLLVLAAIISSLVESANVLIIIPFTSKSHYIVQRPIGLELSRRGHNVTVITANKEVDPPPNYHEVMVDDIEIWDVIGEKRPNIFTMVDKSAEEFYEKILWGGGYGFSQVALNSTKLRDFLKKDNTFDLVISEHFYHESFYVLAHKYKAPLTLITTVGNCMNHNFLTGNPLQLSTVVQEYLDVKDLKRLWNKMRNTYFTMYVYFWWKYWYLEKQEQLVKTYLAEYLSDTPPSLYEIQKNASLLMINSHFSFDPPTALLPNIVEIGGIHLSQSNISIPSESGDTVHYLVNCTNLATAYLLLTRSTLCSEGNNDASNLFHSFGMRITNNEAKSLLQMDLKQILDDAKDGVIYMNFGSNVRSSELPIDKKMAFVNIFKKLKLTVLWKWEDQFESKLSNLVTRKWLPQKEILAHPNIKVFIAHGGLIGIQEAIFNGVPIVGVPIYGDQYNNMLQVQEAGFGRMIEYHDINERELENILSDILNNVTYRNKADEISRRFKDRLTTPLDTAMFWLEYVIRHKGADFMKNPARELSWFEYMFLDVFVFLVAVLIVFVTLTITGLKLVQKLLRYEIKLKTK